MLAVAAAAALPASAARRLTVGAYYYAWYPGAPDGWTQGYARGLLSPAQPPRLGEYPSDDPRVIAQHFAWAQQYGVDLFVASWRGPYASDDAVTRFGLLASPARGATRIAVLYESLERLGLGADDRVYIDEAALAKLRSDFDYLAATSMADPAYYRVAGRPLVVLYVSRNWTGRVADGVRTIRQAVRARLGVDPYIVGDEVDWDIGPQKSHIRLFDAITSYTMYSRKQDPGWPVETRFLPRVDVKMRQFAKAARRAGVRFVPGAQPGFNDRGVRPESDHYVLTHELAATGSNPAGLFSAYLSRAGQLVDPKLPLLLVTSWNEWYEDSQIEPTAPAPSTSDPYWLTLGVTHRSYGSLLLDALSRFKSAWEKAPAKTPQKGKAASRRP